MTLKVGGLGEAGEAWDAGATNKGFARRSQEFLGYPNVIVPLDLVDGLPIGMSFIGTAWEEKKLIQFAYAFEKINGFFPKPKF